MIDGSKKCIHKLGFELQSSKCHSCCCIAADMLFQDPSSYSYLSNGNLPVSGWDDASDLQDSLVSDN